MKLLDSTRSTITLGWTKPVSDGGAPLIGYVVEMRGQGTGKKGDDGWKRCNVAAQLVMCEFTVTSLDEKLVYEFRVSAQNQVGMSPPCDLEGAVIPREILGEDFPDLPQKSNLGSDCEFNIETASPHVRSCYEMTCSVLHLNRGTRG